MASGGRSLISLSQEVDLVELVEVANAMPSFNQFAPVGADFLYTLLMKFFRMMLS